MLRFSSEQCEPGLVFWLVEELLDSQTIDGCRNVFDYLDSRRERITAVSNRVLLINFLLMRCFRTETFQEERTHHTSGLQRAPTATLEGRRYRILRQGLYISVSELSPWRPELRELARGISC